MKPKPIQESVAEEEVEMRPVPVPDYTQHFGKTARPVASNCPTIEHRSPTLWRLIAAPRHPLWTEEVAVSIRLEAKSVVRGTT